MKWKWSPASSDPNAFARQFEDARRAGRKAAVKEPAAAYAAYDPQDRSVDVRLRNGTSFRFLVERIPELAPLSDADLATVEVTASDRGLHWEGADVHLSVPHLMGADGQ